MALNYSYRSVFPAHISEDDLASPLRIVNGYLMEGVLERNGEGYTRPWHVSQGEAEERNFNCGRDRVDRCSSPESTSKDIVDLLPSDPFGMDIKTTFTAIAGWLEDMEVNCEGYMSSNNAMDNREGGLFAGWNFIWNNSLNFHPFQLNQKWDMDMQSFPSNLQVNEKLQMGNNCFHSSVQDDEKLNASGSVNTYGEERGMGAGLPPYDIAFQSACNMGGIVGFSNGSATCSAGLQSKEKVEGASNFEALPQEALVYVFSYLGLKDLLSAERVCKASYSAVRDPLLWRKIHIDHPYNEKITDDVLMQLANRAQGQLQCLSLVECPKVTDDCLRHILETNPEITKLCVPGCTRLSIEFIVDGIKAYNSNKDVGGIKHLRIGGLYGVNHEHFEELKLLTGADDKNIKSHHKPHFYHRGNFYLPYDDDRAMDIEMCPRCEKFRLVYDCPAEGCKVKDNSPQVCRACTFCIARCAQCGRCINNTEFEETFCLELLCSGCFQEALKYQEKLVDRCEALNEPNNCFNHDG
ncbi:hypothetical protein CDL12_28863 [Handroanthus impetiginosus]|uniref:F-box domain-containing protein n=1 Tax=Handroanthus impetiginosus TaxID=429701 RepID=A0A2G9G003_9LAMI|nr:hypothetical protein CDL12_28863 [Handroanthus impetiginosus]